MKTKLPSMDAARRAWEEAEAQGKFWEAHFDALLKRYPEQFVAVADGTVVAADSNLDKLLTILESRGYDPRRVWVRFLTADVRRVMP